MLAGPWEQPEKEADGWKYFEWIGWIHVAENDWIFHTEHGWMQTIGQTSESLWFHDQEIGWMWSGDGVYPYCLVAATGDWLLYGKETSSPRYFLDLISGEWTAVSQNKGTTPGLIEGTYDWRHRNYTETAEHELLGWTRDIVTTQFTTHIIENDLIRVTLLPDWGARILSIYYKPFEIELLSYARGDKFSDIIHAPGAFYYDDWLLLPGGINPTFPEGEHGKYWGEVWSFQTIEEEPTHTTVRMSRTDDLEWDGHPPKFDNGLTGMTVDMDVTVYRNRSSVEINYTLTNNKNETIPYEFWMAASLAPLPPELTATSSNLEIVMKQEKILLKDWWNWMKSVETDDNVPGDDVVLFDKLAWLYNWQGSGIGYAYPQTDNPWWGVINHDYDWGVLRTANDPSVSPGMKIWGTGSNYGMFELWSGNSSEFFEDAFLAPLEVKSWKEYFIPTVELSAISHANSHGAAQAKFNIGSFTGYLDISVFSTWQTANWRIDVFGINQSGPADYLATSVFSFTENEPAQSRMLPILMEFISIETVGIEVVVSDLFTGEERMRFTVDPY
ncbi:MAG: hypothetical protein AB3N63_19520 [Puniceicoccaceae bacterium]